MRFLHTADLHIGKSVNGFSMIDDQRYILDNICKIIVSEGVDAVLLSGDIYDKSIPTQEAVTLFNDFLSKLYELDVTIFIISGNHDSADRLNFGQTILKDNKIYISSKFDGDIDHVELEDEFGPLNVYMLPFVKPTHVNHKLNVDTETYDEALRLLVEKAAVNPNERNIILAHQFVTVNHEGPDISDSEVATLGGLDNVSHSIFNDFDYVALGHIHKPQPMGRQSLRYSGSILKYSLSEAKIDKSVVIVTLHEKDNIEIKTVPLIPVHNMVEFEASLQEVLDKETFELAASEDYVHIILTDTEEVIDAAGQLRSVYPNLMQISFKHRQGTQTERKSLTEEDLNTLSPKELFHDFFIQQQNSDLNSSQMKIIEDVIKELEDGDNHETH